MEEFMSMSLLEFGKPTEIKDIDNLSNFEFILEGEVEILGVVYPVQLKTGSNWNNFDKLLLDDSYITIKGDLPVSFNDLDFEDLEKIKKMIILKLKNNMRQ
jgi:hypothetical protein